MSSDATHPIIGAGSWRRRGPRISRRRIWRSGYSGRARRSPPRFPAGAPRLPPPTMTERRTRTAARSRRRVGPGRSTSRRCRHPVGRLRRLIAGTAAVTPAATSRRFADKLRSILFAGARTPRPRADRARPARAPRPLLRIGVRPGVGEHEPADSLGARRDREPRSRDRQAPPSLYSARSSGQERRRHSLFMPIPSAVLMASRRARDVTPAAGTARAATVSALGKRMQGDGAPHEGGRRGHGPRSTVRCSRIMRSMITVPPHIVTGA